MKKDFYWDLFWQTGMPEAWMLSRPMENDLFLAEMAARDLRLPKEARQLRQKQESLPDADAASAGPTAES